MALKKKFNPLTGNFDIYNDVDILKFKEGVATQADLPTTGNEKNDARITSDNHHLYVWDGTQWVDQGDIFNVISLTHLLWDEENGRFKLDGDLVPYSDNNKVGTEFDYFDEVNGNKVGANIIKDLTNLDEIPVPDIKDATINKHEQNKDQYLDYGGANQVSASDVKDAVNKKHSQNTDHKITDADSDTFLDVEETSDKDEIVGKVAGVEALRIYSSGISDLPKQSRCRVYMSTNQDISSGSTVIINFDSKDYDVQNEFDTTNHRFTATKAGYYLIAATIQWYNAIAAGSTLTHRIYKNGAEVQITQVPPDGVSPGMSLLTILYLSAGDYVDIRIAQSTGNTKALYGGASKTTLSIEKVG